MILLIFVFDAHVHQVLLDVDFAVLYWYDCRNSVLSLYIDTVGICTFFSSLTMSPCVCVCSSFHIFSTWGHSPLGVNGTELRNVRISIQSWSWLSSEQMKCVSRRQQSLWCFQFQSFSQYRSKVSKKSEDEIEVLRTNPKVSCLSVSLVWTHWYWSNFYHPEVLGGHQCWGNLETVDDWSDLYYPEVLAWGNRETLLMMV